MKLKASYTVEKEIIKFRSRFALPFSQFGTRLNLGFLFLLGSPEDREHGCCEVLEPNIG